MVEFLLLREILVLLGAALASYTDWKDGLIYDKITYPMIAVGVLLNLIEFNWTAFSYAAAVFVVGYILYYSGKIGGGDVKLFTGITLLLPVLNGFPFILSVMFIAAVAAIIGLSSYYVLSYARKGIKLKENLQGIIRAGVLGLAFVIYFYMLVFQLRIVTIEYMLILFIPMFFGLLFLAFERGIKKEFFLKKIKFNDLEEDDLVALEFLDVKLKKKLNLKFKGVIGEKEKEKLKEMKVKEILVYRDMPKFAPFIFLGIVVVLAKPDIVNVMLGI